MTFEEGRAHLGIETQRQWSDRASERSTPLLFGLSRLVTLFGQAMHPDGRVPFAQAAWYRKQTAPFRDILADGRRLVWSQETFPTSAHDPGVVLVPRSLFERLSWAVCYYVGNVQITMSLRDTTTDENEWAMGYTVARSDYAEVGVRLGATSPLQI